MSDKIAKSLKCGTTVPMAVNESRGRFTIVIFLANGATLYHASGFLRLSTDKKTFYNHLRHCRI